MEESEARRILIEILTLVASIGFAIWIPGQGKKLLVWFAKKKSERAIIKIIKDHE